MYGKIHKLISIGHMVINKSRGKALKTGKDKPCCIILHCCSCVFNPRQAESVIGWVQRLG